MLKDRANFLKSKDYQVYRYLETVFTYEPDRWVKKETLISVYPDLFNTQDATSHDICSTLNAIRLRINEAASLGFVNHIVLLNNNTFKIAKNREEALKYCKKDYDRAIKLLVRFYQNIGVIKRDSQGRLFDCNGNPIDENSLAKPFYLAFEV